MPPRKKPAFKPDPVRPARAPWMDGDTLPKGRAARDGVFAAVTDTDRRWGVGRLRLLLTVELRERFDRQWAKFNVAHNSGGLPELLAECTRTLAALEYCNNWAEEKAHEKLDPTWVFESRMPDGAVLMVCQDASAASLVRAGAMAAGRRVLVYDMGEVARLIHGLSPVSSAKAVFPGATVEEVRTPVTAPEVWLDDPDDDVPF